MWGISHNQSSCKRALYWPLVIADKGETQEVEPVQKEEKSATDPFLVKQTIAAVELPMLPKINYEKGQPNYYSYWTANVTKK